MIPDSIRMKGVNFKAEEMRLRAVEAKRAQNWTEEVERFLANEDGVGGGMPYNLPALFRLTKFYTQAYPITAVAATQGTKLIQIDLKKYITGDSDFIDRVYVNIHGNIVVAGAGPGTATGADNPTGLCVSANLSTSPVIGNAVPINNVSSRGMRYDDMFDDGWLDSYTAITDAAGTKAVDFWIPINFRRSDGVALEGIDWTLAGGKYSSLILQLVLGGRDQLFTGGTNTWDLSGLSVDFYADIDQSINPQFIHAHELYEVNYPITATQANFQIINLAAGFVYTDFLFLTEDGGALTDGVLNNISIYNGGQRWFNQGEGNAPGIRQMLSKRNNRDITGDSQSFTGIYMIPMRDGMFTRSFDCRYSPLVIALDVVSLSATTNVRLVGRRMLPGAVYTRPKSAK